MKDFDDRIDRLLESLRQGEMNAGEVRQMLAAQGDRVGACCSARMRFAPASRAAAPPVRCPVRGALTSRSRSLKLRRARPWRRRRPRR